MIMSFRSMLHSSANFPQRLYALMENNQTDMISWCNHGLSFRINEPEKFSSIILPKYFKHAKLTSFQRQLNLYGFKRITKGEDLGAYFHPKFQRGRKDLLNDIRRVPNKSLVGYVDTSEYNPSETMLEQPIQVDVFLNESPIKQRDVPIQVDFFLDELPEFNSKTKTVIEKPRRNPRISNNDQILQLNMTNEINLRKPMVFPTKKGSNVNFNSKPKLGGPSKLTISLGFLDKDQHQQLETESDN